MNVTSNIMQAPEHLWSIDEDKLLIDCLFKNSSFKHPNYISSIVRKNVIDSKADEKINRQIDAIYTHIKNKLMPLLLQYHQGTINTPWKYLVLEYIYENKVMSASDIREHMTEINKHFPWLDILSISTCYYTSSYNTKKTLL